MKYYITFSKIDYPIHTRVKRESLKRFGPLRISGKYTISLEFIVNDPLCKFDSLICKKKYLSEEKKRRQKQGVRNQS